MIGRSFATHTLLIGRVAHSTHDSKREDPVMTQSDTVVLIENGRLLSGIVCKKTVGPSGGGLIHTIRMEYTDEIARQFYGNVQTTVNNWLLFDGMSIGISDTIADEKTYQSITGAHTRLRARFVFMHRFFTNSFSLLLSLSLPFLNVFRHIPSSFLIVSGLISAHLAKAREDVKAIILDAQKGALKPTPGNTLRQTFENKV